MDYDLKGGVLIIGSLLWQDDRDGGDGIRKRWRETRLDINKSTKVSMPIRYGRFSKDRAYTMVFDKTLPTTKYGRAKAIQFKGGISSWNKLHDEVRALSEVEGNGATFIKGDEAWCVCCILLNKRVAAEKRNDILKNWNEALNENRRGREYFLRNADSYSCTAQGELEIPWPSEITDLDFLIATSTEPRNRDGINELTVREIADHIANREYFIPNFVRGIGTFQDRSILEAISSSKPLTQLLFKAVIAQYEFKKGEDNSHRFWSWDHCYHAFHSQIDNDTKALHLANYLASWGMNRGSGGLLQKDYRIHLKAVEIMSSNKYSTLDCFGNNDLTMDKIDLVVQIQQELSNYYSSIHYERMGDQFLISPTDTLISKILLGTLSCTVAHDEFLKLGLQVSTLRNRRFSGKGLKSLFEWTTQFGIESLRNDLPENARNLPLMKLVDVYFWTLGYSLAIIEK